MRKNRTLPYLALGFLLAADIFFAAAQKAETDRGSAQTLAAQQAEHGLPQDSTGIALARVTGAGPMLDGVEVHSGHAVLRITALRDNILRIQAGPGEIKEDGSWAVLPGIRSSAIDVTPAMIPLQSASAPSLSMSALSVIRCG